MRYRFSFWNLHAMMCVHPCTCRSVGTPAAMPPPVCWLMVQTVGRGSAVRTVSSEPMAVPVVRLWESVMCWSTAVGIPLTALLISTSRMATAATLTSHIASLACAAAIMSSVAFTGDQVCACVLTKLHQ